MSVATLAIRDLPAVDPFLRLIVVDCGHGTTRVFARSAPEGVQLADDDAVRVALAKHWDEEHCACTRQLWREYFGAALGELILVEGGPHV